MGVGALTDDLVTSVRALAMLPDADDFDSTAILRTADEEMETLLVEIVKSVRGEHWLTYQDFALSSTVKVYQLPDRCLARFVRGVGSVSSDGVFYMLPQIDPVIGWERMPTQNTTSGCYFFQDDSIVFPASPPTGFPTMRVWYIRRPSQMVSASTCSAIRKAPSSTTLTLGPPVPTWISGVTTPVYVDIVRGNAPFSTMYTDLKFTSWSSPTFTLDSTTPINTGLFVDLTAIANDRADIVCQRGQTGYVPLPSELFPVLVSAVVWRVLEAKADPRTERAEATYMKRRKAAIDLIDPRNEQGGRPIINVNSPLRGGGIARAGRRYGRW